MITEPKVIGARNIFRTRGSPSGPGQMNKEEPKTDEPGQPEPSAEKQETRPLAPGPEKPPEGAVEGTVSTINGPLAKAIVSFADLKTVTDSSGRFLLEHLPVGSISLTVASPTVRYQNTTTQATVVAEKNAELFVFLGESTGSLEGGVRDEEGSPLAGAQVVGLFRAAEGAETSKVDDKGHYSFRNVPPGSHFIRASAPGFMTAGKSVEVVGDRPTTCSFALARGSISLAGKVADQGGAGVDSEVYLLSGGIVVTRTNTKAGDGGFVFSDLVPGNYELMIVAPGYAPRGWMGTLTKDEKLEFRLEEQLMQEPSEDPTNQSR